MIKVQSMTSMEVAFEIFSQSLTMFYLEKHLVITSFTSMKSGLSPTTKRKSTGLLSVKRSNLMKRDEI